MVGSPVSYDDMFEDQAIEYGEKVLNFDENEADETQTLRLLSHRDDDEDSKSTKFPLKTWLQGPPLDISTTLCLDYSAGRKSKKKSYRRSYIPGTRHPRRYRRRKEV